MRGSLWPPRPAIDEAPVSEIGWRQGAATYRAPSVDAAQCLQVWLAPRSTGTTAHLEPARDRGAHPDRSAKEPASLWQATASAGRHKAHAARTNPLAPSRRDQ